MLFDRIAWPEAANYVLAYHESEERASEIADIQFLLDRKVIFTPEFRGQIAVTAEAKKELEEVQERQREHVRKSLDTFTRGEDGKVHLFPALDGASRVLAIQLRELDGLNAVALLPSWSQPADSTASRADVVRLVLNNLPVPKESHSIEDVLAFREEATSQGLTHGLRSWINEMASGKLTPVEIADKLEYLSARYEAMLGVERMERDTGMFETLICTTAEIAESLVKFKWSNIAKKLFEVKHKQVALLKAEMSLPGREVAYIIKARERFNPAR